MNCYLDVVLYNNINYMEYKTDYTGFLIGQRKISSIYELSIQSSI